MVISTPDHWHAIIAIAMPCRQARTSTCRSRRRSRSPRVERSAMRCTTRAGSSRSAASSDRRRSSAYAAELVRNGRIGQLKTVEDRACRAIPQETTSR